MQPLSTVSFDADFFRDPYAALARLRASAPVHRAHTPDGAPIWLVTRYADVRAALLDSRLSVDKQHSRRGYRGFELPPALDANLLNRDGADHRRIRRATAGAFLPRRVAHLRPRLRQWAHVHAERLADLDGPVDLVADYALPFTASVLCEILGVPEHDRTDIRGWILEMFTPSHPDAPKAAVVALHRYLLTLIAAARKQPGEDILSGLISTADEQGDLTEDELTSSAFLFIGAGFTNPVGFIGNALVALLDHPEQLDRLRRDPALWAGAIDELLRFDSPTPMAIRRFTTEDVEIGGVVVPAGETVMLSFAAANHDPEQFSAPETLSCPHTSQAKPTGHFGFGHGAHNCVGAAVARAQLEAALEVLVTRYPELRLAVPRNELRRRESFRTREFGALPVVLGDRATTEAVAHRSS